MIVKTINVHVCYPSGTEESFDLLDPELLTAINLDTGEVVRIEREDMYHE